MARQSGNGRSSAEDAIPADILAPLPGPNPAGRPVRYEGDYDRIGEARRDENAALPQGVWVRDVKQADWGAVERLCLESLGQRSKDLRIACWLVEAWVHLDGFAGLSRGLGLLGDLCARFWDDMYPLLEPDDPSARIAPLEWLNQHLPVALRLWPVVADPTRPDDRFTWADYIDAERLATVRLRDAAAAQKAENRGAVTLARFEACQRKTPSSRFEGMAIDLRQAMGRLAALDEQLTRLCGKDAPGLGRIKGVAEEIAGFVSAELASRRARDAKPALAAPLPPAAAPTPSGPAPAPAPALTRTEAYRRLGEIADFLLQCDPHSPAPYVLRRMADWGALPLPDLIQAFEDVGGDLMLLMSALGYGDPLESPDDEDSPPSE